MGGLDWGEDDGGAELEGGSSIDGAGLIAFWRPIDLAVGSQWECMMLHGTAAHVRLRGHEYSPALSICREPCKRSM